MEELKGNFRIIEKSDMCNKENCAEEEEEAGEKKEEEKEEM